MYKKKDDIIFLIESLTSGEKRHFYNLYKDEVGKRAPSNFWLLFEAIREQKSQMSKLDLSARSLTSSKRLLYDNLLKSLRLLHENASIDISIQNMLTNVELLYNHSLAEQAKLVLNKAHTLAIKNEKFGLQIQALDWEKRLNVVLTHQQRSIDQIIEEENIVIDKMLQMKNLESIYSNILSLKKKYGYARGVIIDKLNNETIHSPLMPQLLECKSKKAEYYFNLIYAVYYWMTFNHEMAFAHSLPLTKTNESNVLPNDYINGLLQHITSAVCVVNFKEAIDTIYKSENYIVEHKLNQSIPFMHLMFTYHSIYKMIVYNYMGEEEKLQQTVSETEWMLDSYGKNLPFINKQVIMGNLMISYIGMNQIDKAENLRELLFNKYSKTIRLDIYGDLYLIRLFILLYQKNIDLIFSAASSAFKFYKKQVEDSNQFEVEYAIAQILKREYNWEQKDVYISIIKQLKNVFQQFIAKLNTYDGFQEHYTRYVIWCDALLHQNSFAASARKWYQHGLDK